ncbi:phosphatidylserine decarboxylase Psd3 [Schizosaccharomyces cryophilus OY26]|uniref:Phosphatidylserine decarboxylase proenzyme 2 n=1 Tax=Schizosaccharomyces cryophilus (strain OY26 / ATCC MYA-4695 / CBS 11777 / NBRC 106824 / NRRL Y48691) TaxID=653667 RepID=S9W4A3_SCHCR|nr:phosphatidylserine decarboxylase Psd3 [Schizosaccharomyces cryophilus OY26]EPY53319.1 phosphatidylserine decarboxylase Psd3 [Schizosaccharomyces cryophilus OY26]
MTFTKKGRSYHLLQKGIRSGSLILKVEVEGITNIDENALPDTTSDNDSFFYIKLKYKKYRAVLEDIQPNKTVDNNSLMTLSMPFSVDFQNLGFKLCFSCKQKRKKYTLGEAFIRLDHLFKLGPNESQQCPLYPPLKSTSSDSTGSLEVKPLGNFRLKYTVHDPRNPEADSASLTQGWLEEVEKHLSSESLDYPANSVSNSIKNNELDNIESDLEDSTFLPESDSNVPEGDFLCQVDDSGMEEVEDIKQRVKKRLKQPYSITQNQITDLLGFTSVEIVSISNLPPLKNVFRTGFDMDPFVIMSFSKNTFRTKRVRHNLNPVYNQKFLFEVGALERKYDIIFKVIDHDKISLNDSVGVCSADIQSIISAAAQPDPVTGLYKLKDEREIFEKSENPKKVNSQPIEKLVDDFSSAVENNLETDVVTRTIPLKLFCSVPQPESEQATLTFRAIFFPFAAVRQKFWRVMLTQYGEVENEQVSKLGMYAVLDSLGSNIPAFIIDSLFQETLSKKPDNNEETINLDEAVICLEKLTYLVCNRDSSPSLHPSSPSPFDSSGKSTPIKSSEMSEDLDAADVMNSNQLNLVCLHKCPLCLKCELDRMDQFRATVHVATCASHDWKRVDRLMMSNYLTLNQAQRKWFAKAFTKVAYGSHKLGSTSAKTLVRNRKTGHIIEEKMNAYVRVGIRLLYRGIRNRRMEGTRVRKLLRSLTLRQGIKYDSPLSTKDIVPFIRFFDLNTDEMEKSIDEFKSFNEFFYRRLKPGARPVASPDNPNILISAADSRLVVYENINIATTYWIKGAEFSIARLLGPQYENEASQYMDGSICIFRLAPQDYHRFHSPVDGKLGALSLIEGQYYTVNPMAIRSYLDVFSENVRTVLPIESPQFGRIMYICIGAMMVGSIQHTADEGQEVKRGDELGYFKYGGSTIVVFFKGNRVMYDDDLLRSSKETTETLLKMGESVGKASGESLNEKNKKEI